MGAVVAVKIGAAWLYICAPVVNLKHNTKHHVKHHVTASILIVSHGRELASPA